MRKFLLSGLLAGIVAIMVGCSSQPAPTPSPSPNSQVQPSTGQNTSTPSQTTPSTSRTTTTGSGKDIYDKNCAGCHGAAGAGGSAPALNSEKRTQAQVSEITKSGKGSMPGFASLGDTQIQAVSQYVVGLKK
jgi:Cytochrome c, mono- and diheme variants